MSKSFSQTTEEERLEVIRLFTKTNNNSTPSISKKMGLSNHSVSKIIDEYLKEKQIRK